MQVSEVMHKGVSTVQINDSMRKVAAIMKREDIGAVPVFKNERPVGFVTDRDIVVSGMAQGHPIDDPISHAMSRDILFIRQDANVEDAAKMMRDHQVSRLLVVDSGEKPVGMLSLQDIFLNAEDESITLETLSEIKRS